MAGDVEAHLLLFCVELMAAEVADEDVGDGLAVVLLLQEVVDGCG